MHDVVELRIDTFKLCFALQRPWPRKAQDIGSWQPIMQAIISLAVVINAAIMVFVLSPYNFGDDNDDGLSRKLEKIPDSVLSQYNITLGNSTRTGKDESPYLNARKVWCFNLIQYGCFAVMIALDLIIPDVPDEVEIQLQRQEYWVDRYILLNEDEDDEDEVGNEGFLDECHSAVFQDLSELQEYESNMDGNTLDNSEVFLSVGDRIMAKEREDADCEFTHARVEVINADGTFDVTFDEKGTMISRLPRMRMKKLRNLRIETGDGSDQSTSGFVGVIGRVRPVLYNLEKERADARVAREAQRKYQEEIEAKRLK